MDKDTRNWINSTRDSIDSKLSDLHHIAFHKGDKPSMDTIRQVKILIKTLTEVYEGKL